MCKRPYSVPWLSKGKGPFKAKARRWGAVGVSREWQQSGLSEYMVCIGTWPPESHQQGLSPRSTIFTNCVTWANKVNRRFLACKVRIIVELQG